MKEPEDRDLNHGMAYDSPSSERMVGLMALLTVCVALVIVGVAVLGGLAG